MKPIVTFLKLSFGIFLLVRQWQRVHSCVLTPYTAFVVIMQVTYFEITFSKFYQSSHKFAQILPVIQGTTPESCKPIHPFFFEILHNFYSNWLPLCSKRLLYICFCEMSELFQFATYPVRINQFHSCSKGSVCSYYDN